MKNKLVLTQKQRLELLEEYKARRTELAIKLRNTQSIIDLLESNQLEEMDLTFLNYLPIGERLKEFRKRENIKQRILCKLIGLSHATISQLENNIRDPRPQTIEKIEAFLNSYKKETINNTL